MSILDELKKGIPSRFSNMSPYHFEEFICELFEDLGYSAKITKSSGDFGADIIAMKDNKKTAVQVKRFGRDNNVGVKEIQQVIAGRDYYKCDKSIIITTSTFTKASRKLASETGVELWDWEKLYNQIKRVYFGGKDVYKFFNTKTTSIKQNQVNSGNEKFVSQIEYIRENVPMKDKSLATIVHVTMTNTTDEKIYITIGTPIIITTIGGQIEAYAKYSGGFEKGYIYPQASFPIIFCWYNDQLPKGKLIKNVIVKYQEENEEVKEEFVYPNSSTKIMEEKAYERYQEKKRRKSGCFIATAVYGTPSALEIDVLRDFRDEFLLKNRVGEKFVNFYYRISPSIANFISKHCLLKFILRELFIGPIVKIIKVSFNYLKK